MRRPVCLLIAIFAALTVAAASSRAAGGEPPTFYVAPTGDDHWSGKLPARNAAGTDGPFATLERARDAIRSARSASPATFRGATVLLRAGVYALKRPLELSGLDSGTAAAPIVYRAFRNEEVHLSGGREVGDWRPVTDPAILARIDLEARDHVLVADLTALGITDYGKLTPRGFGRPESAAALELFFNGAPMTLARWPNAGGWAKITGAPNGAEGGRFTYESDRPSRWTHAEDAWLHGYWTFDWADTYEKVAAIDPTTRTIATEPPHGAYGYAPGRRFYALNLLEELDAPGEWYLDRRRGALYFRPPSPITSGKAVVSLLNQPLVTLTGASFVTLQGIVFEYGRASGVVMRDCQSCVLPGCTVRDVGVNGVVIDGGKGCGALSCDIFDTGDSGISLSGGDRRTLEPGRHFAENCLIQRHSRWDRTYRPAIGISGVGNRASHNRILDGPHNAILMGGNDHLIEYNDISRVCTETGDAGAVYMGRDLAQRGTIIRHNHFHDIGPTISASEPGRYTEVMAVYLDDCYCGVTVTGNLFERAGRAVMLGGGRDNTIADNLFIDCNPAIHIDQRGKGWAANSFKPGGDWNMFEHLREVPFDRPPYSDRYPHLANILNDDPQAAKYNRVLNNRYSGSGKWIDWLDGMSEQTVQTEGNASLTTAKFVDAAHGNYRLRSPERGFAPLPFSEMGLRKDGYRRKLPAGE